MSIKKALTLAVLIPVGLAVGLPALAMGPGDGPRGDRPGFEELDLNGDGQLTLEELAGQREARFAAADTDGDGMLSRDELIAGALDHVEARIDRQMERFDDNEDGMLSANEADDMGRRGPNPERMFGRMDADADGVVTQAEFDEAVAQFMQRRGGQGQGHGRGGPRNG